MAIPLKKYQQMYAMIKAGMSKTQMRKSLAAQKARYR